MKVKRAVLAGVILLAVIAAVLIAVLLNRPGEPGGPVSAKIAADEFTLENSRGERLELSRGELAGDMEAELPGEYREGEANQFELARGSDEYVFETAQERIELVLGNSEWEQAFEGSGVERAVFAPGAGLTLEGGLITGTVAVNYPAGAAYRPFRMDLCGEGALSVKTTETGVEVSGLSDIRSIRASYSPAGEPEKHFSHVDIGAYSGGISIDLSGLETSRSIIITDETGAKTEISVD